MKFVRVQIQYPEDLSHPYHTWAAVARAANEAIELYERQYGKRPVSFHINPQTILQNAYVVTGDSSSNGDMLVGILVTKNNAVEKGFIEARDHRGMKLGAAS